VELRRTRAADLPALFDIFNAAIGDLYRPHGFDPPAPPFEVFANQQRHLLAYDGERCVVADRGSGELVAFAAAWVRGDAWFLASLFVHPDAQAAGVGRALLDAVWGDELARRLTITDAIQPVSNALYARCGLIPVTPVLSFGGVPRVEQPPDLEPVGGDADAAVLSRVDVAAYGFDRRIDHAYWQGIARRTVWARDGEAVAWSYVFPGGAVGPIAGVDGIAAAAALAAELARAGGEVRVRMPGSSRRAVAAALAAGLRLSATPGLLLLSHDASAPTALVIGSYTLL
jgi:GNAT superfamily N-acetyltransferase